MSRWVLKFSAWHRLLCRQTLCDQQISFDYAKAGDRHDCFGLDRKACSPICKKLSFVNFDDHSGNQRRPGFPFTVSLRQILQESRRYVPKSIPPVLIERLTVASYDLSDEMSWWWFMASSIFYCSLHERMPEMHIVFYQVIDECSDIFLAAHILPVLNRKFILPIWDPYHIPCVSNTCPLLGLFSIGGGATGLSITTFFPLTSNTLLFRKGILPYVCFSPCIRHTWWRGSSNITVTVFIVIYCSSLRLSSSELLPGVRLPLPSAAGIPALEPSCVFPDFS